MEGKREKKKRRKSRIRYGGEEKDRNQDGLLQQLQRAMTQGYTTFQYTRLNSGWWYIHFPTALWAFKTPRRDLYKPVPPSQFPRRTRQSPSLVDDVCACVTRHWPLFCVIWFLIRGVDDPNKNKHGVWRWRECFMSCLPCCLADPGHKSSPTPQQELIVITIPSVQGLFQSSCYASL